MSEKVLNNVTVFTLFTIRASDMPLCHTAYLYFAFCPFQTTRPVSVPRLTAFTGFQKLTAGLAVCPAASDFICIPHGNSPFHKISFLGTWPTQMPLNPPISKQTKVRLPTEYSKNGLLFLVDPEGVEPLTSAMRTQRSPN